MNKYGMIFYKVYKIIVNIEGFKFSLRELKAVYNKKGIESFIFIMDNNRINHYRGLIEDNKLF
ncbi:hypothetical protein A0H76_2224 [Hepatospora eriocheir]|uniref:Uncharacterized protein n=1 Tax=Hepatospora eriocheir TaxID=1081669 RepID=A0A1X0QK32_9MICR|nr:hypothetical protein A0H76_2224 [Hepatospora eriocheir]